MRMKYVVVQDHGLEIPILFPEILQHKDVARCYEGMVLGAGFVSRDEQGQWFCCGGSVSLKISSRVVDDSQAFREFFKGI